MASKISHDVCSDIHHNLEHFAGITSVHGVPRIINASSIHQRIFWSLVFLFAVIMFIITGTNLLTLFFSYPKKVNVEIVQKPVPFPSVTVCNTEHLDIMVVDKMFKMFNTEDNEDENGESKKMSRNARRKHKGSKTEEEAFLESYSNFQATLSVLMQTASLGSGSGGVDLRDVLELMSRMGLVANVGPILSSRASIKAKDFIVYCRFMEEECNITETFVKIFDPYFFNCYTFEPKNIIKSTRLAGIEHGLTLLLFPGSAGRGSKRSGDMTMIPGMVEGDAALATNQGAKVVIHSQDSIPHFTTNGVDIPSGDSVSVGIRASLNIRVPLPHGNCTRQKDVKANSANGENTFRYTLISCQNQCIQSNIAKSCGCVDSRLSYREEDLLRHKKRYMKYRNDIKQDFSAGTQDKGYLPFCLELPPIPKRCRRTEVMFESEECWEIVKKMASQFNARTKCRKVIYDKMTTKQPEMIEKCQCHPPCQDVSYEFSHTVSKLPQNLEENTAFYSLVERYLESLPAERRKALESMYGPDYRKEVKKGICRLNVYIADNNIIKVTESPDYDIVRLISDIGGQMGLWIGISVITLVEVLQLFADLFGVISKAMKKLWRLYVNGVIDDKSDAEDISSDFRNGTLTSAKIEKDLDACHKSNSELNKLNQKAAKDRFSFDETEGADDYFLNKLTTV